MISVFFTLKFNKILFKWGSSNELLALNSLLDLQTNTVMLFPYLQIFNEDRKNHILAIHIAKEIIAKENLISPVLISGFVEMDRALLS